MNRTVATCAVLAGTTLAYHVLFGRRHLAEIAACHDETTAAYARFEAAERQAALETALLEAEARLEAWRGQLTPPLRFDPAQTPFQLTVMNGLKRDGLVVERTEAPQSDVTLGRPNQKVRVSVQGPLQRIVAAICRLENSPTPTRVVELNLLAGDVENARGELTIVRTWSDHQ